VAAGRADVVDITLTGLPYRPSGPSGTRPGSTPASSFSPCSCSSTPRKRRVHDIKARQAVNYAIDRTRMIQLLGFDSPGQAAPTCQLLRPPVPPQLPALLPYTAGPQDGAWHGPRYEEGPAACPGSGTTQVQVTLLERPDRLRHIRRALPRRSAPATGIPGHRAQCAPGPVPRRGLQCQPQDPAGLTGWAVNIPTTSDFFLQILTCARSNQDPAGTANVAGFCEPQVDRWPARRRRRSRPTRPAPGSCGPSSTVTVTDQAPLVPVLNTSFTVFVSARVGNYQESPSYGGPLLDQIWVR